MNFIPFDSKTKRIIGGNYVGRNFPEMVIFPPGHFPVKGSVPYLEALEDPTFAEGEEILVRKERNAPTFVFYCDSVAGGKDISGKGTKKDPCRSLVSLMKLIFCRKNNIPAFLGHTKMCIKIYLKGVVDYSLGESWGYFPFPDYLYEGCYKDPCIIIAKWEDDYETEAIIKDQVCTFCYTVFQGIHFQDFRELFVKKCYFENCVFTDISEYDTYNDREMDCFQCRFEIRKDLLLQPFLVGRYSKDCEIVFQISGDMLYNYGSSPHYFVGIEQQITSGGRITVEGKNIFDSTLIDPRELGCLLLKGIYHKTTFDVRITDPLPKIKETHTSRRLFAIGVTGPTVLSDCRLDLSAEFNFEPYPYDDVEEPPTAYFDGVGFFGYGTFIRCHAENKGIKAKNGEGRFCGFISDGTLIDCTASPSDFESGCLT